MFEADRIGDVEAAIERASERQDEEAREQRWEAFVEFCRHARPSTLLSYVVEELNDPTRAEFHYGTINAYRQIAQFMAAEGAADTLRAIARAMDQA